MSLLTSRRLIIAAVTFAIFVVFDIALFGWLIFDSLSQREVEKVLLTTRAEAEPLARELEERARKLGQDLYVAVSVIEETRTYIQSFPTQREVIQRIEIRDRAGTVVYHEERTQELPAEISALPRLETGDVREPLEVPLPPTELSLEEVEVPIGDLGTLIVGISDQVLQERVGILRQDLVRQTSLIGVLTLSLLLVAFAAIWILFRRARRLEEQAEEAERLAYIGTLASGLAHEIRNPLNSLSLNVQMLEEEISRLPASGVTSHLPASGVAQQPGGTQKRLLAITRSELQRLERLATDFLSYAKPRPVELKEVPAVELLERVVEVMGGEIHERGARVEIEELTGGARVRVDRGQIGQLLFNLTQNALAACEDDEQAVIRLVAREVGGRVALEVSDDGPGIPEEDQARIFDLFYSTRKGGTGLGLAIAKRIARAHDTDLEVDSQPGAGTTMRLPLPVVEARRSGARRAAEPMARRIASPP